MKRKVYFIILSFLLMFLLVISVSAKTTINVWTGYPELDPFYKWAGAEYSKTNPNVTVKVLSISLREFEQKLTTAISSGTGPEVFDTGPYIAIKLIDAGLLPENPPDIDAYLKSGPWSDFAVNYATIKGRTYGIPLINGSRAALFYNKTMFIEAGLDSNNPPKTFPELIEAAKKLTKYDNNGQVIRSGLSLRISGAGSGVTEKFRFVLHNAGGDLIVPAGNGKWKNGLNNKAGQEALKFYIDALYKYKVDDPKVKHDSEAFVSETTAMFLRESWVINEIKSKNPKLDYGVAPMPSWQRSDTLAQPWAVYMSLDGAKSKEVREFTKFLTSEESASKIIEFSGWIPERNFDLGNLVKETPQYQVFIYPPQSLGYYSDPVMPAFDEIQTKVADKLVEYFLDKKLVNNPDGIKKAIEDISELVDSILKRYNSYSN